MMTQESTPLLEMKNEGDLEAGESLEEVMYGTLKSTTDLDSDVDKSGVIVDAFLEVPQGRHLGLFSTMVLFVSRIVGSGIFATPSAIYVNCGGNKLIYFGIWILAALLAFAGLFLYLEYGSLLPRSGGRKNFLEQTYTKPRLMMSVTFACFTVLTGFTMSNAIVFGKYFLCALGFNDISQDNSSNASKFISIGVVSLGILIHGTSVRYGVMIQNFLGGMKFVLISMMCMIGLYSLVFWESGPSESVGIPVYAFQDEAKFSLSSAATAFISTFFCFTGWDSVHSVASEIKNPTRTLKIAGPLSLFICFTCYTMMNIAYFKVLTYEEIKQAGPLVGSILFSKLFGPNLGGRLLSFSVALSTLSNIMVVLYGVSRMNQEVFREGYLPFSIPMASNWPWSSPLPSLLLCGFLSVTWLSILPPGGSSFDYLVAMEGYANQFFLLLVAIGIFIYRRKHKDQVAATRASSFGVVVLIFVSVYLMIAPFLGEQNSNSIGFLPPYQITALLLIGVCFLYWLIKFFTLPKVFGYTLLPRIIVLDDGLVVTKWVKRYKN